MRTRGLARFAPVAMLLGAALTPSAYAAVTERMFINSTMTVPQSVLTISGTVLPERSNVSQSYLSNSYDPNLEVVEPANVFVTFLYEGAGYKNTLGYFTYTSNGTSITIKDRQLVFPNASFQDPTKGLGGGGLLASGDTVMLRTSTGQPRLFQPGEKIGFFIVSNGWNGTGVNGWNEANPTIPSTTASVNATRGVFTSIESLNPEASTNRGDVARHIAMLNVEGQPGFLNGHDFLLMGFEDQRRDVGSDNDFNDLVMVVSSNPPDAVEVNVPKYYTGNPDPDGDGVLGLADYFPNDPERAFIVRTPAAGWQTIAFEDTYPNLGDGDFNDVVIDMAYEEVLRADGKVKDLSGTFHLIARGASLDHAVGVSIPGIPMAASGTISFDRFTPKGLESRDEETSITSLFHGDGAGMAMRIGNIFPSTKVAMTENNVTYTNTNSTTSFSPPSSSRFVVTFDDPIARAPMGLAPYDPYISIERDEERWDVHLMGKAGFSDRPGHLPVESGATSFTDDNGYPFALLLPTAFRYPLERVRIDGNSGAYPNFAAWRTSGGVNQKTWYTTPSGSTPARVIAPVAESLRARNWTLKVTEQQ